jgi:hypothetical protein
VATGNVRQRSLLWKLLDPAPSPADMASWAVFVVVYFWIVAAVGSYVLDDRTAAALRTAAKVASIVTIGAGAGWGTLAVAKSLALSQHMASAVASMLALGKLASDFVSLAALPFIPYPLKIRIPQQVAIASVHFTVTTKARMAPGETGELWIWAHRQDQLEAVRRRARVSLRLSSLRGLAIRSTGPFELRRGAVVSLTLDVDDVVVANPRATIEWNGGVGQAHFVVSVREGISHGPRQGVCAICLNGLEIGRLHFLLQIGVPQEGINVVETNVHRYRRGFAPYASEDRDLVAAHIHGMRKVMPIIYVFLDVLSLRSNDDWDSKLLQVIPQADVLYLFWCGHAKQSEWVEKEWRCALRARGAAFIDVVPLESPESAPHLLRSWAANTSTIRWYRYSSTRQQNHPLRSVTRVGRNSL